MIYFLFSPKQKRCLLSSSVPLNIAEKYCDLYMEQKEFGEISVYQLDPAEGKITQIQEPDIWDFYR